MRRRFPRGLAGTPEAHREEARSALDEADATWPIVRRRVADQCDEARKALFNGVQLVALARCHLEGGEIPDPDLRQRLGHAEQQAREATDEVIRCFDRSVGAVPDEWTGGRIEF